MEKMSLHVKRDSLLGKVVPGKSLHGWDEMIFCDEASRDCASRMVTSVVLLPDVCMCRRSNARVATPLAAARTPC